MAYLATYTQQPHERLDYDIPCDLVTGDSLATVAVTVAPVGLTVDAVVVGSYVKLWVEGGASGVAYKLDILITTALGRKREVEVRVKVKEF